MLWLLSVYLFPSAKQVLFSPLSICLFVCLLAWLHKDDSPIFPSLPGRVWYGSVWIWIRGRIQDIYRFTVFIIWALFNIFAVSQLNKLMKEIRHISGTDICECVKSGAVRLLVLGGGMHSTE